MTPRQKVIANVANVLVMIELSAHLEEKGFIDDKNKFVNDFLESEPEIKKMWKEVHKQICGIRKVTAEKLAADLKEERAKNKGQS